VEAYPKWPLEAYISILKGIGPPGGQRPEARDQRPDITSSGWRPEDFAQLC